MQVELVIEAKAALDTLAAADIAGSDRAVLEGMLADLARVRGVVAGFDVEIARRSRQLAAEGRSECAEDVLSEHGRRASRDARAAAAREQMCADPVICRGAPPAYEQNRHNPETFQGCEYTYRNSSAMAENGYSFPLTVDVVWHATWSASNGASGDLGHVSTTSETRWLPVAEIQAIITDTHSD